MYQEQIMKTLMILAMALLASPAWGYKHEDLDKLAATNTCQECDLAGADLHLAYLREANLTKANLFGADLRGADLRGTDLSGAVLRDAELDYAVLNNAILCNTFMPDGQRIFQGCSLDIGKDE